MDNNPFEPPTNKFSFVDVKNKIDQFSKDELEQALFSKGGFGGSIEIFKLIYNVLRLQKENKQLREKINKYQGYDEQIKKLEVALGLMVATTGRGAHEIGRLNAREFLYGRMTEKRAQELLDSAVSKG